MKKWCCFLFSLLLLAATAGAGQWVDLTASTAPPSVEVAEAAGSRVLLDCQINGFEQSEIIINGESYQVIGLAKEGRIWEKGDPELPVLNR
ncbi:MAG: hypothetical protein C4524_08465, partial [Candidatus Zixiibacteriota bacterium]